MAGRKPQHDAEFFPFYAKDGRTLFMLQARFGLEGIGFFTNLMRLLCTTPYHYVDLQDPVEAAYTWSKIGLSEEAKAEEMITLMVRTGKLDRDLWEKRRVVYCQQFVDSLSELYAKRKEKPLSIHEIYAQFSISGPEIPSANEVPVISSGNPGSEIRKGEKRIEEKREYAAFAENGLVENFSEPAPPDPPDPEPEAPPEPPAILAMSPRDLADASIKFGLHAEQALEVIALHYQAGGYRYARPWAGVCTWFAKAGGPLAWLESKTAPRSRDGPLLPAFQAPSAEELARAEQERESAAELLGGIDGETFVRSALEYEQQN